MFAKVLVANRGEIAVRVMRALDELGIASVAVYSEADREALHVRRAAEAYLVGPGPAPESYLNVDRLLDVIDACGAEAVHPGYGFLAENAAFARGLEEAGVTFIGPPATAIDAMGSKTRARELMQNAGVPIVPGTTEPVESLEDAIPLAGELPFSQDEIRWHGHAIECRINAEDAAKNFAPAPGTVTAYFEPSGPGVRVDSGVVAGSEITPLYDPMVAKLIVWDADREKATRRMARALDEFQIEGVRTLIPFHKAIMASEQWANGETCRDLIEDREWLKSLAQPKPEAPSGDGAETVERDYLVEVSGKRFEVKV